MLTSWNTAGCATAAGSRRPAVCSCRSPTPDGPDRGIQKDWDRVRQGLRRRADRDPPPPAVLERLAEVFREFDVPDGA
jgi:hypothetical protein